MAQENSLKPTVQESWYDGMIHDYGYLHQIYNDLYSYIGNDIGVIALMANLYAESACSPNRLQGDVGGPPTSLSINYTNSVNDLSYSRQQFRTDQRGYGLAQWTIVARKTLYYDYVSIQAVSIGDIQRALGYLHAELRGDYASQGIDYRTTLTACQNATDLHTCTDYVLDHFENPLIPNYTEREQIADDLVVTLSLDGVITACAEVIGEDAKLYRITMYSKYERPHLDFDSEDGAVERFYGAEDDIVIEDHTQDKGYIIFQTTAQDQSDMMVLYFFADKVDSEVTIPQGVYPINHLLMLGTVLSSTGANEDNTVSPSLYSTLTDCYLDQLYFLVDGTVTVEKVDGQLRLEVKAVNSYDVPVHVVYDASATAVENTVVENNNVRKVIKDNQLLIIKDGLKYNVLGYEVK